MSGVDRVPVDPPDPVTNKTPAPADVAAARTYTGEAVTGALAQPKQNNKAIVAIAAELRLYYQGDASNTAATQAAANAIASRYGGGNEVKDLTNKALQMVLHETPDQRATNSDLSRVDQAGANVAQMEAKNNKGQASAQQVSAANANYLAAQQLLMADLEKELGGQKGKSLEDAEKAVLANHITDPELTTALAAAGISEQVTSTHGGGLAQIKVLATQLSMQGSFATQLSHSGLSAPDISATMSEVQNLVLTDPGVKKVIQQYASDAASRVSRTEGSEGAQYAADQLQQIIVQQLQPAVSTNKELLSVISAKVINACMPTIQKIVGQTNALTTINYPTGPRSRFEAPTTSPEAPDGPQHLAIASDLSQVVDVAAAGGTSSTGQYDNPEIAAAVNGVAQSIATHPQAQLQPGLKAAVGQGYATLALATALQTKNLTVGQMSQGSGVPGSAQGFAAWKNSTVESMLKNIHDGLGDLRKNADQAFKDFASSTPQLTAQDIFAGDTDSGPFNSGVNAMINGLPASNGQPGAPAVPGLKEAIQKGIGNIASMGFRLNTTDYAVTFYSNTALGKESGYQGVQGGADDVLKDPNAMAAISLSPDSRNLTVAQTLRQALVTANGPIAPASQPFSSAAQVTGDLTEFLAESYWAKVAKQTDPHPGTLTVSYTEDDEGASLLLDSARIGHSPFAVAWAAGGTLQFMLTDWLGHNSHPGGPGSLERKSLTMLIVSGFAALHTGQAAAAFMRWLASDGLLGSGLGGGGSVKGGTWLDNATRLTVEPTLGLIQGLTVLMGLASLSDAAGLTYDLTGAQPFGSGTQKNVNSAAVGANLFSDVTLFRLQLRGWAQQVLGKAVLTDAGTNTALKEAFTYAMYKAIGQPQLIPNGVTVSNTLETQAQKILLELGGNNAQDKAVVAQKILAFDKFLKTPESERPFVSGPDGLARMTPDQFLAKDGLGFDETFAKLSATTQQSVATNWALEGDGAVAKSLSKTLALGSRSAYLKLFEKGGDLLKSLGGGSSGADTVDLADLLAGGSLDTAEDVAGDVFTSLAAGSAADAIPVVGWVVNGIYLITTVGTALFNQHESSSQAKQAQYTFLRGVGIDDAHAKAMADRGFFSTNSNATGLANAYIALGGNPDDFVSYINKLPVSKLDSMISALSGTRSSLPATSKNDYWTLPADPTVAAQRQFDPNLTQDPRTHDWQDKSLGLTYEHGQWYAPGATSGSGTYYDPTYEQLVTNTAQTPAEKARFPDPPTVVNEAPQSVAGLKAWFLVNGVPLPTVGSPAQPRVPTTPTPSTPAQPLAVGSEPSDYAPLPTWAEVKPWAPNDQDASTLWGIAAANRGTLLSEKDDETAMTDHWSEQYKTYVAFQNLVALNPGKGLTADLQDANTVYPKEDLNVVNPEAP
jgi:hypothetical protein